MQPAGAPPEPAALLQPLPQLVFPPASHAIHRTLPAPVADAPASPRSPPALAREAPPPQHASQPAAPAASTPGAVPAHGRLQAPASTATPAAPPLPGGSRALGFSAAGTPTLLPRLGSSARARARTPGHALSASADCAAMAALGFREPLVSGDDNLKVIVRVRPMNERELDAGPPGLGAVDWTAVLWRGGCDVPARRLASLLSSSLVPF